MLSFQRQPAAKMIEKLPKHLHAFLPCYVTDLNIVKEEITNYNETNQQLESGLCPPAVSGY